MGSLYDNPFKNFKHDIPSGIVVFLVAVPLCLGIALASGVPLFSGLIAGIVGGIVVGSLSGSSLGVSGPAAGLVVIVITAIEDLGSFEAFLLAVMVAGVFQIVLGIIRAGIIGYYFPSSVIKGMLSGIGLIILLKQIPHAVGYDKNPEGNMSFTQPDGENTFSELANLVGQLSPGPTLITLLSLGILIIWEQPFMKKKSFTKIVQGPLVVVLLGVGFNLLFSSGLLALKGNQVVTIPVAESFSGFLGQFSTPDFSMFMNPQIYVVALTIAVVASLETLLSVEATDRLDPYKRVTPTNRELMAQGAGNMVSGALGGLPITQVIVRSSTNVYSGGRTKMAAIFHGLLLIISVMILPQVLNLIPLASLAAILFLVGYKLASPALFKGMYKAGYSQFIPFMVTVLGLVFTDLLIGVGMGLAVGIFYILWNNFKTPFYFSEEDDDQGEVIRLKLAEQVSFLNKAGLLNSFKKIPHGSKVILDVRNTISIHPDAEEIIEDFQANAPTRNIEVEILGNLTNKITDPVKYFDEVVVDKNGGKKAKEKKMVMNG